MTTIVFASLQKFYAIIKSLTPSESIPKKSNHDLLQEKYHYVHVGTLEPMRVKDILAKNNCFLTYASVLEFE